MSGRECKPDRAQPLKKMKRLLLALALLATTVFGQGSLTPARLLQPSTDSWPTYNGDYSGRRFSTLSKVNANNINSLSLAWVFRAVTGTNLNATIKSTPLVVNGVMYFTVPDHVWAIDARTGRQIWHYSWLSQGGDHIGNRGVGILGNWLFFETPDCHLVSLDLREGKERWRQKICDLNQYYFASVAPVIVKNHVIVGVSGDDLDIPGYLQARSPETGELQWQWNATPKPGEPGSETWPNAEAMAHGGGMTWVPSTYDPDLNLLYLGTGNPQPVIAGKGRKGDNLFTESIVALNADTGKLAWHFQPSPHDTHDWDAVQTPVLFDGEINGQPRKLLAQASRNGWFFVLDRTNGKNIITSEYVKTNWTSGLDSKGQPIPSPAKEPQLDGALVSPNQGGAANWHPPSFSPETGLFYVNSTRAFSVYYIFDDDEKPQGWGGNDRSGFSEGMMQAIDYKTGKVRWSHKWEGTIGRFGVLSTAGNLVFTGDPSNNFVALNARTGEALWHANLAAPQSNGPITFELDGSQYVVTAAGDKLFSFVMLSR